MNSNEKRYNENSVIDCTPYNLKQEAMLAMENLLPAMSKQLYENLRTFYTVTKWKKR